MPKKPEKPEVNTVASAYKVMGPRIDLINALMGGTEAMREAGEQYLPRYEAESQKNYLVRKERAVLLNYFSRTVEALTGKPFSKPVTLGDDMPEPLKDIAEDIDQQGNHINVFARRVFKEGLAKGITYILVEYPNVADNPAVMTAEDETQTGARPYFVHIPPENVIAVYAEWRNGHEVLTHVRILEEETVRDGFGETTIERVRVLEPGWWELWRKGDKNKWFKESEGLTSLDFIPLVIFYAGDREDVMVVRPPLTDLAHLNIAHWQSASDQRNVLTVARFPMLAASGVTDDEGRQKVGPNQFLTSQDPNGKWYYVEHTGAAIETGRQDLEDLKSEMAMVGTELLRRPGTITATEKAIDTSENHSLLQALVIMFADRLEQAFNFAGRYIGLKDGEAGSVSLHTDFGISLNAAADLDTLFKARAAKEISHVQFLRELMRRGVLEESFLPEEDQQELDKEADKAIEEQAFKFKLAKDGTLPGAPAPANEPLTNKGDEE